MKMKMKVMEVTMMVAFLAACCSARSLPNRRSKERIGEGGFRMNILHRDHPEIQRHFEKTNPQGTDVSPVIFKTYTQSVYFVKFTVGTPKGTEQVAVFDTGSFFSWLELTDDYDPSDADTYESVPCAAGVCKDVPDHGCDSDGTECMYSIKYADETTTSGYVGVDRFYFREDLDDPEPETWAKVVFGIGSSGTNANSGVLGVSAHRLGLLSSLQANALSICFPKPPKRNSYAAIGVQADTSGYTTKLIPYSINWGFKVNSVTVGGMQLTNLTGQWVGGGVFTFDTGSALTRLHPAALQNIVKLVKNLVHAPPSDTFPRGFELCYDVQYKAKYKYLAFSFDVDGGGSIDLDFGNLWLGDAVSHCLAFMESPTLGNILGIKQMEGFNFGFDNGRHLMNFNKTTCL